MGELGRLASGAFEDKDMLVGVRKMVLAADDVADAEVDVVGAGCQVVSGHAIGAQQREILNVVGKFDLLSKFRSIKAPLFAVAPRNSEAERESLSSGSSPIALDARKFAH